MSDENTLRKEALQIAKRIKRHFGGTAEGARTTAEDDALSLAERVVKIEEMRTVDRKFDRSEG